MALNGETMKKLLPPTDTDNPLYFIRKITLKKKQTTT